MWPATSRPNGLQLNVDVDREKASRLNVLTQAIDDTLYDAFGQRQVSTIFTQLNQYRVILEVEPQFRESPDSLDKIYVKSSTGQPVPLSAFANDAREQRAAVHSASGAISGGHALLQLAAAAVRSVRRLRQLKRREREIGLPETIATTFTGSAAEFRSSLTSEPFLILAAIVVIYIVLGVLYESYIHPITILSTLPSAGVGALARVDALRQRFFACCAYRNHFAHRYREEERDHDDRLRAGSGTQGRHVAGGIDLSGLSAAVSADHDDDGGGVVGRTAAGAGERHRQRIAQAAGYCDCRRAVAFAISDPLYHAGHLSLSRPAWVVDRGTTASWQIAPGANCRCVESESILNRSPSLPAWMEIMIDSAFSP